MSERIVSHVMAIRSKLPKGSSVLIGVSGCQGSGKTFNSRAAVSQLQSQGLKAVAISLDDYYIDHAAQQKLALEGNPLLAKRGLPGTHDVPALVEALTALKTGQSTDILQYEKSCFNGAGDRCASIHVDGPVDAIVLEGWMVGFMSLGNRLASKAQQAPHAQKFKLSDLKRVDDNLIEYHRVWNLFDALILMQANNLENVYTWRLGQEHELIKRTGNGMTDSQIVQFVDGYMPAYELYLDGVNATDRYVLNLDRQVV